MEIFEKEPLTWGLRGDPELWQELKNRFRGFDYSVNPETFNEILTRHFNAIIEKGIKKSEDTIFFETYSKKGMSEGHVSLEWWYKIGLPILRETYFKNHLGIYRENQILLQNILPIDDLAKEGKVLLIRHYHDKLKEMLENGVLEEYQSFQKMPAFRKAKYIISFTAEPNNYAKLYGVYKIGEIKEKAELPEYSANLSKFCNNQNEESDFYLTLNHDNRFSKYEGRIIIDWIVPRGWYNTYGDVKDKPVMKITPGNFVDEFPGLMKINISAYDLRKIIENPETHSNWRDSLTKLQAVYLIMDNKTGNLYVGTTYGKDGLWQRWESYVKSGFTGGNAKLESLKGKNSDFYIGFQYSILEVLPRNANQKDCNSAESLWKEKLGTRAFGLNMN